jgi:hypothetical protein
VGDLRDRGRMTETVVLDEEERTIEHRLEYLNYAS